MNRLRAGRRTEKATRDRILKTAGEMFAKRGYDGVSIRDITGAAKANLGAITYHFGGKEGLFAEVLGREMEVFENAVSGIEVSGQSPEEKLKFMLGFYAERVLRERPRLRVLLAECVSGSSRLPKRARNLLRRRNAAFAAIVRQGQKEGVFGECDTEVAAWNYFGMLAAYILLEPLVTDGRRNAYSASFVRRVVDTATGIFLNGLKTRKHGRGGAA
ncbi:MAG: TetR/AcrR family transcriptional regulator [Lentisphaerae bacterium]|nr:TetR/AcrR family transcriptional regulator [Lentisphaerota bacterium]